MTKQILKNLPVDEMPTTALVGREIVAVRAYQIIVWVSLGKDELPVPERAFPAVLDTGHGHNFSINETQLLRWTGLAAYDLPKLGDILVNGKRTPLHAANLWVHRNRPGTTDLLPTPVRLVLPGGISVFREGVPPAARLPLMGMRTLVKNDLRLVISGKKKTVSLRQE